MKDRWEKLEILTKFLSSIVLAAIPIVIGLGAAAVSRSVERAQLVDSLISELTDVKQTTRRDIAILALESAVTLQKQCDFLWYFDCHIDEEADDVVAEIALVLFRDFTSRDESETAAAVVRRRKPEQASELLANAIRPITAPNLGDNENEKGKKEAVAEIITTNAGPNSKAQSVSQSRGPEDDLKGVDRVFIQYRGDLAKASELKKLLREHGVSVPKLQLITSIAESDIRYANEDSKIGAEKLKKVIELKLKISITNLIDLKSAGYNVPPGQFEVWLNL